ncbi:MULTISPECIES: hypothetical protein [unclassified Novosphingobium]|uniref:hypothetical protein n=1 Tax=unclassified Novosphingobium TaxID=2644732 RepID=UPI000EBED931|nr:MULTISPECIES: hypothetical protein [unclassified Novosphingobium]HCF24768.1 hypothetical protein [Novosphingobium sp.]HQV02021.1 hypothetical protein [Novosphingobium sp.]
MNLRIVPLALVLTLSACGGENGNKAQSGTAQGEVLPGSVSDAMIAVDQVKSQAPLAPKSENGDKKDDKTKPSTKETTAVAAAPPPDEPEAEPATE